MDGPFIQLENIEVMRDGEKVLHDIDLAIEREKTTVVMGPSGCGKSILLKIAALIFPPDGGTVYLNGRNMQRVPDKELIEFRKNNGFVFQDAALWANKTVFQNVSLPLEFHYPMLSQEEIKTKIERTLHEVGYRDSLYHRPAALSAGERQLISFARALIIGPSYLFMDSPTMSLDHENVGIIIQRIKSLKKENRTMIISTNNATITSLVADNIVVMKEGTVLMADTFDTVVRSRDPAVQMILSDVLSKTSTYDDDILDLLNP